VAASAAAQSAPGQPTSGQRVTRAYALVVGDNIGAKGQQTLQYAEQDARQMTALLKSIGDYAAVRMLIRPKATDVLSALEHVKQQLYLHQKAGEQTTFLFYYSGHAQAHDLNIGSEKLSLEALRARLLALPTKLRVAIFDACQSGSFSRIKGVTPAQDFSYNSVSQLHIEGTAVMASSTGSELSQESDQLQGGYFTHYLMVALRGAGDKNKDGLVSLDEAYRYAYVHTLSATSKTVVGGQHATLETDLRGHGQVPLTYPAQAKAQLEIPQHVQGKILIQQAASDVITAELTKSSNVPIHLALVRGVYRLTLQKGDWVHECSVELKDGLVTRVEPTRCPKVPLVIAHPRSGAKPPLNSEHWGIEIASGWDLDTHDRYSHRLSDFGYTVDSQINWEDLILSTDLLVEYKLSSSWGLIGQYRHLDSGSYQRLTEETEFIASLATDTDLNARKERYFSWSAASLAPGLRYSLRLCEPWLSGFAQTSVGLAFGSTRFATDRGDFWHALLPSTDLQLGLYAGATVGVQLMFWQDVGFVVSAAYDYARFINNSLGDVRDSGGFSFNAGARFRIWR